MFDFRGSVAAALVIVTALIGHSLPLHGQSMSSALLEGTVVSESGEPIGRASLAVRDLATGVERSAQTSPDGHFSFEALPPGEYGLLVEQLGYYPRYIYDIPLHPGQRLALPVTLATAAGPVERVDSVPFEGALLAGRGSGLRIRIPRSRFENFPDERRGLTELARYSSLSGPELDMQGLPAALSGIRVDGVDVGPLSSAALVPGALRTAAFPISAFDQAAVVVTNPDVEWSGHAGGTLDGYTSRGTRELGIRAFGSWSGGPLLSGVEPSPGGYQSAYGGVTLGASLIPDTATMLVGVEARRLSTPIEPVLGASTAEAVQIAQEVYGLDIAGDDARLAQTDVLAAFGRFDWQLSSATSLNVRANLATVPNGGGSRSSLPGRGLPRPFDGRDLSSSALLSTRFSDRVYQEVRIGFETSGRTFDVADEQGLPGVTRIVGEGVEFGPGIGFGGAYDETAIRASETLHIRAGEHRLKLGLSAALSSHEYDLAARSQFLFPDLEAFAAGEGYVEQLGPLGSTEVSLSRVALYAQDTWTPVLGLDVLLGARVDVERLPSGDVRRDEAWFSATGLDNTDVHELWWRVSPRVGFTWDIQDRHAWVLSGSTGLYTGSSDSGLLAEWIASGEGREVRAGYGAQEAWPRSEAEAEAARSLTLLHPEFAPPRTFRTNLGLSRLMGPGTAVHLSALLRHTDLLPRTRNLNLIPNSARTDQHGGLLYGELDQVGALLFPAPGSNRRFMDFDRVAAIDLDGWSTYRGVTLGVEHQAIEGLEFFGSYTFSQTEDNWAPTPGTSLASETVAPAGGDEADWMEGRSDFDVPHRAVVGAEAAFGVVRLAGLYRYRSGSPFTPGFREGVDANADGSWSNDIAFIDESIAGMEGLLEGWECLQEAVGRFAERNSCRTEGVHSLDARVTLGLRAGDRYSAELFVDGLNLLGSEIAYLDQAVYLVDPSRTVSEPDAGGTVTVPLVANENFGSSLGLWQPGRVLRVGFRLNY